MPPPSLPNHNYHYRHSHNNWRNENINSDVKQGSSMDVGNIQGENSNTRGKDFLTTAWDPWEDAANIQLKLCFEVSHNSNFYVLLQNFAMCLQIEIESLKVGNMNIIFIFFIW